MMKTVKTVISVVWFMFVSIPSPVWIGCIYMNLTGHGKGYGYDLKDEAGIYVFLGVIELLIWILAVLPVTISLCKKGWNRKKAFVWLPLMAFAVCFAAGICMVGWDEFIKLFGYGYPA